MPVIVEGNDGVSRIEIDGELYPINKAESVGDAPEKSFDMNNNATSKNLISISLNKDKDNLESEISDYYQQMTNIRYNDTEKSEDAISIKTPVDVFQKTSDLDNDILKEVLTAIMKAIEVRLHKVTTFTYSDDIGRIHGKEGDTVQIEAIEKDEDGNLSSVTFIIPIDNIRDYFSEKAKYELPNCQTFGAFLATKNNIIIRSLKSAFYQQNQDIDIKYLNVSHYGLVTENLAANVIREVMLPVYMKVTISKICIDADNDVNMIFSVIKNRIDWYMNEGGSDYDKFIKLTRDMSDTYILLDTDFVSNTSDAARCSNVNYDLPLTCEKILDNCSNIQAFLKKHYEEFFEYMMQFDMYVYLKNIPTGYYECTIYIPSLEIRKSPKWFSWFTQPALKRLRKDLHK